MSQVRIRQPVDAAGDPLTARVSISLVTESGNRVVGWNVGTSEPVSEVDILDLTEDIVLELLAQSRIATASGGETWYRVRMAPPGALGTWDVQVPESAEVVELADLVGAAGIDPGDILAGRLLTTDERAALDAANSPDADNPIATMADVAGGVAGVASFAGRTGVVVPAAGDYAADEVSVTATPAEYTTASAEVEAHLAGIDTALGSRARAVLGSQIVYTIGVGGDFATIQEAHAALPRHSPSYVGPTYPVRWTLLDGVHTVPVQLVFWCTPPLYIAPQNVGSASIQLTYNTTHAQLWMFDSAVYVIDVPITSTRNTATLVSPTSGSVVALTRCNTSGFRELCQVANATMSIYGGTHTVAPTATPSYPIDVSDDGKLFVTDSTSSPFVLDGSNKAIALINARRMGVANIYASLSTLTIKNCTTGILADSGGRVLLESGSALTIQDVSGSALKSANSGVIVIENGPPTFSSVGAEYDEASPLNEIAAAGGWIANQAAGSLVLPAARVTGLPSQIISATAGEDLSGHRAVRVVDGIAWYADASTPAHAGQIVGITAGAALAGSAVSIQASGALDEPSWSWSAGLVWLGAAGALTQVPPASGISQILGRALSATRLLISLQTPMMRTG